MNTVETDAMESRAQTAEQDNVDTTMFPVTGAAQTLAEHQQAGANAENDENTENAELDAEDARRKAEQALQSAKRKGKELADKTVAMATEKQHQAAEQLDGLARTLRDSAANLDAEQALMAQGVQRVASVVEGLAATLREKDIKSLVEKLNSYTRQQPAVVLGGATVAGFLLARFLKSSAQHHHEYDSRSSAKAMG